MDKVSGWVLSIEDALRIKGIALSDSTELFLEPSEDLEFCRYYLADHAKRSLFWLDQVSTELLGYAQVASTSHLSALRVVGRLVSC